MDNKKIAHEINKYNVKRGKMDAKKIVDEINKYNSKSTEEIRTELAEIILSWKYCGLHKIADKIGVSRPTLYQIVKSMNTTNYRPSFEVYIKLKALGINPIDELEY